jgi:ureidoacrylate peracid hydrolase
MRARYAGAVTTMPMTLTTPLETLEDQVAVQHAALVVVDMQNDFCAEGGYLQKKRGYDVSSAPTIAENIAKVVSAARQAGLPVVWIKSIYDFKYLALPFIHKRKEEGCCLEGTWGADFFMLAPEPDDLVITKHAYSGFHGTPLDTLLQSRGIQTLIFSGVATNVCVESTLRDAFFRGYYVVLLKDCVGSNNKLGHEGTLTTVQTSFGTVVDSNAIIDRLPQDRAIAAK